MTNSLWSQLLETFPLPEIAQCERNDVIEVFAQCVPLLTVFIHQVPQQSDLINQFLDNFMKWQKLNAKIISDFILPKITTEELRKGGKWGKFEKQAYSTIITDLYVPFLKMYNRSMQEKRGIIFTPQYIITFMLSTLETLLKEEFYIKTGLSSQEYLYYDPATGSLNFEMELLQFFKVRGITPESNTWNNQFFGNEINPAAYFLGKFVLESQFSQLPQHLQLSPHSQNSKESAMFPLKISFENALSPNFYESLQKLTGANSNLPRKPLLIVGNPPYAVSSANKGDWISDLMKKYAVPEPNITRLYDDYVKFFRYSDWLLEQHGSGIIALITNRKFLDGKIFYGFRKAMNKTYDKIIIVDLMGDSRNVKHADAGDNVFNIQTGVCISFFCKFAENHKKKKKIPKENYIQYTSITGTQSQIQAQLNQDFHNIKFEHINPISPHYRYLPIGIPPDLMKLWQHNGIPITQFFEKTSRAMISSRDRFMIHHSRRGLLNNIDSLEKRDFQRLRKLKRIRKNYDPILENETVLKKFSFKDMKASILPINYRPLDIRHTIFTTINQRCGKSIILDHIRLDTIPLQDLTYKKTTISDSDSPHVNHLYEFPHTLALNFVQSMQKPPFCHIWATLGLVDSGLFGYSTSKVALLYLEEDGKPNFPPDILQKFHFLNSESRAETIFTYVYGLLLCSEYGRLFQPILLHEYPRIFVMDTPLFPDFVKKIADLGEKLVFLHIGGLTAEIQDKIHHNLIQNFPQIPNAGKLISFRYIGANSMLSLSFHTSTDNVEMEICINCPQILWDFRIGSVQVIKNWIKNRIYAKMENLWQFEDFHSLFTLLYIIENTCRTQRELDKIFLTYWDSFMTPTDIPD
ncbi:MAG: type ISP restriction/modification enzyme, partial [Promethearchaeota archaeon]